MKKLLLCFMMITTLLVSGCSNHYERDTNPGKIKSIKYAELLKKIDNNDKFIAILVRDGCGHCKSYEEALDIYLKDHNVTVYSMNFMKEEDPIKTWDEIEMKILENTDDNEDKFAGTPHTLVFENGELEESYSGAMSYDLGNMDDFDDLVTSYQLDEKKK